MNPWRSVRWLPLLALGLWPRPASADITLSGFAGITVRGDLARAAADGSGEEAPSRFAFEHAGVDLLLTASWGKVVFIGELNFITTAAEASAVEFELDRALVEYRIARYFNVRAGIMRLGFGYFASNYAERWFLYYPVTAPPFVSYKLGIAPEVLVGLEIAGQIEPSSATTLHYHVGVGNGRGGDGEAKLTGSDLDDFKGVSAGLAIEFHPWKLRLGGDLYVDRIQTTGLGDVAIHLDETLLAAHLRLDTRWVTVLGEYYLSRHRARDGLRRLHLAHFFFVQVVGNVGRFHPFVQVDRADFVGEPSPYYRLRKSESETTQIDLGDQTSASLGLAFELFSFNLLKLELRQTFGEQRKTSVLLQSAWAF